MKNIFKLREFQFLTGFLIIDIILNLYVFTSIFSIGWLIGMIFDYKIIRRKLNK